MSMDNPSLPPSDSEFEGESGFNGEPRLADFEQPISAIRSTIRDATPPKEEQDAPSASPLPSTNSDLEGALGSNVSTSRLNEFGRLVMETYSPAVDAAASSSDEDASDDEPIITRRRGYEAIPFNTTSLQATISTTSSTSTTKGNSIEPDVALLPALDNNNVSIVRSASTSSNASSATIIAAADLEQAFFGSAQVLKYRGPHNPISRHMKFPEEDTSSDESVDEIRKLKGKKLKKKKNMWTEDWWAELHEVNGVKMKPREKGNNLVKERSKEVGRKLKG